MDDPEIEPASDEVQEHGAASAVHDAESASDEDSFIESETSSEDESDADAEFYTLGPAVANYQRKLKRKLDATEHEAADDGEWRRPAKRGRRGPQKPVEPPIEIKLLLAQANEAFISRDYDRAEDIATQVIQMNAETYAAHALLSGVFLERGETQLGIVAQMSAAHLRPKDVNVWRSCANLILEKGRDHRASYLNDAIYCYTRMLQINPKDFESRYQRALLLRELNHKGRAAHEFEQMLQLLPHDATILRDLAEVYIDLGEVDKAKERYRQHITLAMDADRFSDEQFSWSDVNIYVELFDFDGQYRQGIKELKTLSRWLLGREAEWFWDEIQDDDREWDADDIPRRIATEGFQPNRFGRESYGEGLPLELRVKLGVYRLKADYGGLDEVLSHFAWLEPEQTHGGARLFDYPDLFQEAADALAAKSHFAEALRFYEPLRILEDYLTAALYSRMAVCYQKLNFVDEAIECYKMAVQMDDSNIDARVQLAKIYETRGMAEEAYVLVNEVLALERKEVSQRKLLRRGAAGEAAPAPTVDTFIPTNQTSRSSHRRRHAQRAENRHVDTTLQDEAIQLHFARLQNKADRMQSGDDGALNEWMETASLVIEDFRRAKVFYPVEKYLRFMGYTRANRQKSFRSQNEVVADMTAMGDRLQAALEKEAVATSMKEDDVPTSYRGIEFSDWLDTFLRYALCLARRGDITGAYEVINAAYDANVFHHSKDASFLIHVCWAACALVAKDDETLCVLARWFMKEFQFTTDVYRFHAALNRLCHGPNTWYNSGPAQKFILRQVKAMDYALVGPESRRKHFSERASYSARDEKGKCIVNDDMDIALLMLYAHMLYSGTSYPYALNYLFRAYALDPENPMINLFIGLSYIHYALKRQSANRQYYIVQGLSFLFIYYDLRQKSGVAQEKQEAEYNVARTFHLLGLAHLALPYYEKVLALSTHAAQQHLAAAAAAASSGDSNDVGAGGDAAGRRKAELHFTRDAAYNLQNLYFMSGNLAMAREVTQKHLVL